ncbi:MAG: SpoIIE family protein phosphatase [Ekhidna sp.]|nr:SpoIIE family protein phosphatase [Ekhidna sp.]
MSKASLDIKDLQLNALLEVTQAVNNNLPEGDLLKIYRFILLADLKVEKLALYGEENGRWICRVHFGTKIDFTNHDLPKKYLLLQKGKKVSDDVFSEFTSVFPVRHKKKLLAVVFLKGGLDDREQNRFLNALTNIILVAIENKKLARKQIAQEAYRRELEIAKKVQNFLFPKELPKNERLQIEAFYLPHHDVGGDYYDYIQLNEDKFLICIADVSGKGVPAALLMSNFQASLRALVRHSINLEEIITGLNLTTHRSGNAENFITFFTATYDFRSCTLEYINCGHNEIILKSGGKIQLLTEGTTVLGMLNPLPFIESKKIENLTDFFILCYTDGLTETFNEKNELFEFDRLKNIVEKEDSSDISRLQNIILDSLQKFKGEGDFHDDITMLSCRVENS